ncbi:hypothetical protein U8M14_14180, partial [Virgibacillus pantothenticus]|uniref:hypothetical protein n=1 Tax=Virgibacillus pantothenticus TaxID=1473 RepID=UPI001C2161B6
LCSTIGKYKIFLVYSIRKTKASAIRIGDKPSFSNLLKELNSIGCGQIIVKPVFQGLRQLFKTEISG